MSRKCLTQRRCRALFGQLASLPGLSHGAGPLIDGHPLHYSATPPPLVAASQHHFPDGVDDRRPSRQAVMGCCWEVRPAASLKNSNRGGALQRLCEAKGAPTQRHSSPWHCLESHILPSPTSRTYKRGRRTRSHPSAALLSAPLSSLPNSSLILPTRPRQHKPVPPQAACTDSRTTSPTHSPPPGTVTGVLTATASTHTNRSQSSSGMSARDAALAL